MNDQLVEGRLKSWADAWYGFIYSADDGRDWFFHLRDNPGMEGAKVGSRIRFRPGVDRQHRRCALMAEVCE